MSDNDFSPAKNITALLRRELVADLKALKLATAGRSAPSLARDIKALNCLSSFTHAGAFYTLPDIPQWDQQGLWFLRNIGFSRAGTLQDTIEFLVNDAPAGFLHREIEALVRVRAHNPLLFLVRNASISRHSIGPNRWLYLSNDPQRAHEQLLARNALSQQHTTPSLALEPGALDPRIAILVETIHFAQNLPLPDQLATRLVARGVLVSAEQVLQVWNYFGIDRQKKTVESTSEPSKR